jgi:hypothetical protein
LQLEKRQNGATVSPGAQQKIRGAFTRTYAIMNSNIGGLLAAFCLFILVSFGVFRCTQYITEDNDLHNCAYYKPLAQDIEKMPPPITVRDAEDREGVLGRRVRQYCK